MALTSVGALGAGVHHQSTTKSENHMQLLHRNAVRAAVVATAVALLATGCASAEPAPAPVDETPIEITDLSVALAFLPNVSYAGNFIADSEGYYREVGLDVTFLPGGPNSPAPEVSIATGEAPIAFESNTARLFSYLADAQDIVIIGARMQTTPNGLLSLAERPVRTAEELHGARIVAGPANRENIGAVMTINDVSDYEFVPGGADVGPLLAGDGDALLAFATNQAITLQQQFGLVEGKDFFFTPFSELDFHLMSEVVIVSRDYLESNREQVVAFMAATIRGWNAQIDDPERGANLAVSEYGAELGLNLEQQIASSKAEVPYMTSAQTTQFGLFHFDPRKIENTVYPSLMAAGIAGLPDIDDVVDTTVLEEAWALLEQ